MSTLYESYTTNDDGNYDVGYTQWLAQTFTVQIGEAHTITSVSIKAFIATDDGGNVVVSIRAVDGDNKPTGSDLGGISGSRDITDMAAITPGDWFEISLGVGVALTAGIMYAIIIRTSGVSDSISWRHDGSSPTYTDGTQAYSTDSGDSWTLATNRDFMFREYGGGGLGEDKPVDKTYSKKLIAVSFNELWYESSAGTMEELTAAHADINTALPLQIFEAYQKIFIVNKSNLKVADFGNVKLHTTDIVPADKTYPRHGTLIEATGGADSGAKMVVDYITVLDGDCYVYGHRITTATFLDTDICVATIDEGDVSFTLDADEATGPFWYNWTTYGNSTTFGSLPNKATLGCNYRGRVMLAGDPEYPYQWYMPRQGNPWDWVYTAGDARSGVAGGNSDAGEIGDIITALIPYKDDFLIFGCANSIWCLAGDPCEGGSINELDLTTGIYGAQSWCIDGEGNLYFWGTNGIYRTAIPGIPVCISEVRLPKLVEDEAVDPSTYRITLAYSRRRVGIVICITKLSDGSNSNYWFDLRTNGFFPETYPGVGGVFSAHYYEAIDPDYRQLIFGCNDGYLRFFNDSLKSDNDSGDAAGAGTIAIDSYVGFGPMPMAEDPKLTGKLTGLTCVTAGGATGGSQSDSDDITYKIFTANSAEEVIEKLVANTNPNIAGTIKAPGRQRGNNIRRKIKGVYMGLKLQNNTVAETWGFEQLMLDFRQSGRFK